MSPAFKKILPLIIIIALIAIGYLLSSLNLFGNSGVSVNVANKADELRVRQSTLDAILPFSIITSDPYAQQLHVRTALPEDTATGRSNPFTQ